MKLTDAQVQRMIDVERFVTQHVSPELKTAINDYFEQFMQVLAQQTLPDHPLALNAVHEIVWWQILRGSHPVCVHIYRNHDSGKEDGELWEYATGALECIINWPWMGEANGVAHFRSNFPDEPVVGTQRARANALMESLGYEATGRTRPFGQER